MLKLFLLENYKKYWVDKINSEPKMRTFRKFKMQFEYEEYLNLNNSRHRKTMTRFRISAHRLAVEQGRYKTPPIPLEDRLCQYCSAHKIEDEHHFAMECHNYDEMRQKLFQDIGKICKNFEPLNTENKFIFILSAGIDISSITASFLYKAFESRQGSVAHD